MSRLSVLWTVQEFSRPGGPEPEPRGTVRRSAESQETRGGPGGLRPGRGARSQPRLAARTRAERGRRPGLDSLPWQSSALSPGRRGGERAAWGEGAGERALLQRGVYGGGVEIRRVRPESGTQGCPPSVTLRDKGPRIQHTCSQAGQVLGPKFSHLTPDWPFRKT